MLLTRRIKKAKVPNLMIAKFSCIEFMKTVKRINICIANDGKHIEGVIKIKIVLYVFIYLFLCPEFMGTIYIYNVDLKVKYKLSFVK